MWGRLLPPPGAASSEQPDLAASCRRKALPQPLGAKGRRGDDELILRGDQLELVPAGGTGALDQGEHGGDRALEPGAQLAGYQIVAKK